MAELFLRAESAPRNPIGRVERLAIEAEIERLIGVLDFVDGDPDLEEDDHPGTDLDIGELDIAEANLLPLYAADQSRGPVNHDEETDAYSVAAEIGWHWAKPGGQSLAFVRRRAA